MISGTALADGVPSEGMPLVAAGLLVADGYEATVSSRDHDDRPMNLTWSTEMGRFGYFDGSRGWVTVDASRLIRHRIDLQATIAALLARLGNSAKPVKPWPIDTVWDLGELRLPHRTRRVPAVILRRVTDPASWQDIRAALLARPATSERLLLAPARIARIPSDVPVGNVLISLHDVVADDGSLAIDPQALLARLDRPSVPSPEELLVVRGDGREVILNGEVFRFARGEQQRRIIRALHRHYLAGVTRVTSAAIIAELDLPVAARLRDYFKKTTPPAWGRLLSEKNGMVGFCLDR